MPDTVFVTGADGYLGWTLSMTLAARGYHVVGVDNYARRRNVEEVGSWSALPIGSMDERLAAFSKAHDKRVEFIEGDLTDYRLVRDIVSKYKPKAIVHFAEQPSAPYSMIDVNHCVYTHTNNLLGTLNILYAMHETSPETHLVKLGTMGEYGTPNIDIPEGFFEIEYRGRKEKLPFPRMAGSWYHWTKVHDSGNIMFACKIWGLSSTDIMQGVVYGTRTDIITIPELYTRFDFDEVFGTAINRFCAQAVIGHPLLPYGKGHQKRGFIALRDSMQCLTIAIENPPEKGEYRVFNQFDEVYSVLDLAQCVKKHGDNMKLSVAVDHIEDPRIEAEEHYYRPDSQKLRQLGFKATHTLDDEVEIMLKDLILQKGRIQAKKERIMPKPYWKR
jgi:UDP-sulfoquinovose synthase